MASKIDETESTLNWSVSEISGPNVNHNLHSEISASSRASSGFTTPDLAPSIENGENLKELVSVFSEIDLLFRRTHSTYETNGQFAKRDAKFGFP